MQVSTTEWLALGIFIISLAKSAFDLMWLPRWFDKHKNNVKGNELNKLIGRKRFLEITSEKIFTVGLAFVTALTLILSFKSEEVQHSDIKKIQNEVLMLSQKITSLETRRQNDE